MFDRKNASCYLTAARRAFFIATVLSVLAACQSMPKQSDDSLYRALGGRAGISQIDKRMLLNIAADRRISGYFRDTDIDRLHRMLTDYICARTGGPCDYTGDNMVDAHRGLGIDSAAFNALVEDLIKAMNQEGVPTGAQNRLLARLAPAHDQIVGRHPAPSPEIIHLILGNDPMYKYIEPKF